MTRKSETKVLPFCGSGGGAINFVPWFPVQLCFVTMCQQARYCILWISCLRSGASFPIVRDNMVNNLTDFKFEIFFIFLLIGVVCSWFTLSLLAQYEGKWIHRCFKTTFTKENNCYDFLSRSMDDEALPKGSYS